MYSESLIYKDEDLNITYSLVKGNPFLHCEVYSFKKSTAVRLKEIVEIIKDYFYLAGYDSLYTLSSNKRFVKFLNFKFHSDVEGDTNSKVYVWDLKY